MKRRKTKRRLWTLLGLVGTGLIFYFSLRVIEFELLMLVEQLDQFYEALLGYFPPTTYFGVPFVDLGEYWAFMMAENLILTVENGQIVWGAMFVTLAVAFAGSVLGLPGALFFGVMASERVVPYPFNFVFRGTMSLIRAIPGLVWFLILIPLAGVTPFTAALAIMVDTTGYLGRLFTDELEEIEDGPIEGIRSTGANRSQVVSFGMLSQVFRQFIAWIAFDLEHNVRAAIGLGIIGGGGLGLELYIQRQTFHYTNMMACIILIFLLAGSVELISQRVRSYLREDDDTEQTGVLDAFVNAPKKILASTMGRRQ
ncbi:phosphonate ABC transporter, permease protein PhnE [Haloarcula taiwanensis]|nr:phosphonate ABC transporter, permease protein PhnE [Haloarcula sinaiiensis]AUG49381.1 phosphonate ABC transporter, permease protein PhnE [Haloarcula taiwanensis]QUJ74904.1 phosphonate ABC transporter, permease protein PhnE [Haloarcula sinaiiensis ATCC 33800]